MNIKNLTWRELNHVLATMTEKQVSDMLEAEKVGDRRWTVLERLHQRLTALRCDRERLALMKIARPSSKK